MLANDKLRYELAEKFEILLSGKTMKKLSGKPKKCYKYALTAVFINMTSNRQLTKGQEENLAMVYDIKKNPKLYNNDAILKQIQRTVENSLKNIFVYNYDDYNTIGEIIDFFREIVKNTKKNGTFLIKASDLNKLLDVNKFYSKTHQHIQPHHWIDTDIIRGFILTVPDFFTYSDIINNWNILLDKLNELRSRSFDIDTPLIEVLNHNDNRRLKYQIDTLSRTLWVAGVTFTESYLYYLFFNLKQIKYEAETEAAEKMLKNQKVEDEEIIKQIIVPEFIQEDHNLNRLLKEYKRINDIRNRFIHPSAFPTEESSELLPLITITVEEMAEALDTCVSLAKLIDSYLPDEYKVLIWWDRIKHPKFNEYAKGDMVNPDSLLSKVSYE
ncbi:hypothetical protein [Salimicrobium jeotgali]|uniref:hypothetical protein n=1 Tax=Salimicrobium jeotgali TaxID=1230341 RepID=UPI000C82F82D|nr:hypothetical protein [Salimicrobium jeotgali]